MKEIWLPAPGYEGRYEVSSFGRIRSTPRLQEYRRCGKPAFQRVRGQVLKPTIDKDGYPRVLLWKGPGEQVMFQLHRLVCRAFHGEQPNALHKEVAHLDGDRGNPRADNLKWVGRVENASHKRLHGTHQAGEHHPRAKLTKDAAAHIRSVRGQRASLAAIYGVTVHAIDDVRRGKTWK